MAIIVVWGYTATVGGNSPIKINAYQRRKKGEVMSGIYAGLMTWLGRFSTDISDNVKQWLEEG